MQEACKLCAEACNLDSDKVQFWDYYNKNKYGDMLLEEPDRSIETAKLYDEQVIIALGLSHPALTVCALPSALCSLVDHLWQQLQYVRACGGTWY